MLALVLDDSTDEGTGTPRPSARWTPGRVAAGAAVACYHGTPASPGLATSLTLATDTPEARDPSYWRQHLGAVAFRLEAVDDVDTMRDPQPLGEWGATTPTTGGPRLARPAESVVLVTPGGVAVRLRLDGECDGEAVYALSPAGCRALGVATMGVRRG